MIMAIGRRATGHSNQVGSLQARENAASVLLHFVMQDGLYSSSGEAPSHVRDGCFTDIKGRSQLSGTPAVRGFEQDAGAGEGAGVGFAPMHKGFQGRAFLIGQGHGWWLGHAHPPFSLSISPHSPKPK